MVGGGDYSKKAYVFKTATGHLLETLAVARDTNVHTITVSISCTPIKASTLKPKDS